MSADVSPAHGDPAIAPASLPPPQEPGGRLPLLPLAYGALAAVALGLALFVGCYLFYVYLVYSLVLGVMLGMAIGRGTLKSGYCKTPVLFVVAVLCCLLLHVVCNVALFCAIARRWPEGIDEFLSFLWLRAQHETLITGVLEVDIGPAGNIALWAFEFSIMALCACLPLRDEAQECRIRAVPTVVAEFVADLLVEGRDQPHIHQRLAERGWTWPDDLVRACVAGRRALEARIDEAHEEPGSRDDDDIPAP